MDIDKLYALRAYIFQYATGMLWLLAFFVFAGTPDYVTLFGNIKKASVPETLVTFLAVALGIIVPYVIATALMPLSRFLHEYFRRGDVAFRKKYRTALEKHFRVKHPYVFKSRKDDLRKRACEIVKRRLHVDQVQEDELLVFVHASNPGLAAILELERHEAWFHATVILPASVLVAACTYQIGLGLLAGVNLGVLEIFMGAMPVENLASGVIVAAYSYQGSLAPLAGVILGVPASVAGMLTLIVGVVHAEKEMVIWLDRVDAAVLLVASNGTPDPITSRKATGSVRV